ncbi:hypothetical protein FA95DRAFT_252655 [Auriscalpium vulgare]|uniref:Uncharacterized protein n=1 Tax=Auriscalpium vulgare TaxID=40419 RepID=A0ACB8RKT2_9AGAM|nr:hypothetical protein FA95DRAFT_252655 [Auriscalpium vulgare]
MSGVPLDLAILWALLGNSILYGVHAVTFGNAVWVLIFVKRRQARRPRLIGATFLLFAIGTVHIALAFRLVIEAFVLYEGPGGAEAQLSQISNVLVNVKNSLYISQVLIGDAMLIYRCFMVHGKNWWIVVLPIILWLGNVILGAFIVYIPFTLHEHAVLSVSRLGPFITSGMSLTLTINIFCTTMIVRQIWLTQQRSLRIFGSDGFKHVQSFTRAIGIIIESAAMYTVTAIVFFALQLRKSNAEYSVAECIVQIIVCASFRGLTHSPHRLKTGHCFQPDYYPRRSRAVGRDADNDQRCASTATPILQRLS